MKSKTKTNSSRYFKRLKIAFQRYSLQQKILVVLVCLLVAIVGVRLLYESLAATFVSTHEAETGTVAGHAKSTPGTGASNGNYVKFGCDLSANLVNSCRPWAGAAVAGNPAALGSSQTLQMNWLEGQVGSQVDSYRQYNNCNLNTAGTGITCSGGGVPLSPGSDELKYAKRANTYVDINWKPFTDWASIGGGNTMVNNEIKQGAANIKAIAPKKVFLTIWHEPQNDVTAADGCTGAHHGTASTPAQYIAMWKNVENIFNSQGVTNVEWAVDYMSTNQADFECQVPQLWPGSNLIDWVLYDTYGTDAHPTWAGSIGRLYDYLTQMDASKPSMGLGSKPWGLGEFGTCGNSNTAQQRQYYIDAKSAFDTNTYPKLKLYLIWDDKIKPDSWACLTNYDADGTPDSTKQTNFNKFYQDLLGR